MMKGYKQRLISLVLLALTLFVFSNSFTFVLQNPQTDLSTVLRSSAFVVVLYLWALVRLFGLKKFAVPFIDFINVVYGMGFISNIAMTVTTISGIKAWLIIVMSLCGILVNIWVSKTARKFNGSVKSAVNN